jgi:hypothetical protein
MRVMRAAGTWPEAARPPAALAHAAGIDTVAWARPPGGPAPAALDTVRVVGPVFSGSVASMHRRLRLWTRDGAAGLRAVVVSGGATAASNKEGIDATALGRRPSPAPALGPARPTAPCLLDDPSPAVDFWATVNPVDSVLAVTRRLLRDELGIPMAQVAVLREASTAFGAAAGDRGAGAAGVAGAPRPPATAPSATPSHCVPVPAPTARAPTAPGPPAARCRGWRSRYP